MPITRRRRANPPDQPENNHHQPVDQNESTVEQPLHAEPAPETLNPEPIENVEQPSAPAEPPAASAHADNSASSPSADAVPFNASPLPGNNGDRSTEYPPIIEGGRRTARGELFRRPPQVPPTPQASFVSSAPLQAPTHEITLPLGNLLHLAYNPGYTGSEEARSLLLHRLTEETKTGGRARCWNCGSLAIAYDRWNTRSRSLGEVGIAFCEICGVWSVM